MVVDVGHSYTHVVPYVNSKQENNSISREYVLPDYTHLKRGYFRNPNDITAQDSQIIRMNSA